jgi:hypothetical protein
LAKSAVSMQPPGALSNRLGQSPNPFGHALTTNVRAVITGRLPQERQARYCQLNGNRRANWKKNQSKVGAQPIFLYAICSFHLF